MTEEELYNDSIRILDNLLEESIQTELVENLDDWKLQNIYKQFKQSKHIMHCLLSNTEGSKFQNQNYVTELILVGSLGRIVSENYVNIAYLTTNKYSIEDMKSCWRYNVLFKNTTLFEFENKVGFETVLKNMEIEKEQLRVQLNALNFSTKSPALQGKDGRLLSIQEIANAKDFNKDKFYKNFEFFSQFIHTTPFVNNLITSKGIDIGFLAATYDKIVPYYVGIITETFEQLITTHKRIEEFRNHYKKFRDGRWKVKNANSSNN